MFKNKTVKEIYEKHVNQILKPKEYYDLSTRGTKAYRQKTKEKELLESKAFAASVLETCSKLKIRAIVRADFNKKGA